MATQYDKYRFRQTPLTDDEFNRRWRDIDKRIDSVEKLGFEFSEQEELIIAEALRRINSEILPVIAQIQGFAYLGNLLACESATPLEIGTGVKRFIVAEAFRLTFAAPLYVIAASRADGSRWMAGQTLAWSRDTGELVIGVTHTRGAGTISDWRISVASIPPEIPPAQQASNVAIAAIAGLQAANVQEALAEQQGEIAAFATSIAAKAGLDSPAFAGNPTAPTQTAGNSSTRLATTEFVQAAIAALTGSAPAALNTLAEIADALNNDANLAGTLSQQIAAKASLNSPALTGTPTAPTAGGGTNSGQIATTAFVQTALGGKANLASPALTGTPTAPTAGGGTNSTQLATTAFVQGAVGNRISAVNVTYSGGGYIHTITPSISGTTLTLACSRAAPSPPSVNPVSPGTGGD